MPLPATSFSCLPYELRSYIWSLAVEPRQLINVRTETRQTLVVQKKKQRRKLDILYETSSTPPPAVVQVCREARHHSPYQQAFTAGEKPRWTWVNFELDVFCITSVLNLPKIVSHQSQTQRLKIRTEDDYDWYESVTRGPGLKNIGEFTGLREIQLVMEHSSLLWGPVFERKRGNFSRRCPGANVTFINEMSGLVLAGPQVRMLIDWEFHHSFDTQWNPPANLSELEDAIEAVNRDERLSLTRLHEID